MTGSNTHKLKIFSGRANLPLADKIAKHLGVPLGNITLGNFPDGETSVRIDEDVRGRDVFIVQPTCPPVNENLMELLIILDASSGPARPASRPSSRTTATPARTARTPGRVPITAKLVADLLTAAGADRVLALDLHAAQIQGFFNIPVDHLYAVKEITAYVRSLGIPPDDLVVLSPDEGNVKKALMYQKRLGGQIAIVDKRRASAEETKAAHLIGAPVEGKTVVIFDDMISTAGSMVNAVRGGPQARGEEDLRLRHARAAVRPGRGTAARRPGGTDRDHRQHPAAEGKGGQAAEHEGDLGGPLLADAIRRIHGNESVSDLFRDEAAAAGK